MFKYSVGDYASYTNVLGSTVLIRIEGFADQGNYVYIRVVETGHHSVVSLDELSSY
jgi:hypothetical protein